MWGCGAVGEASDGWPFCTQAGMGNDLSLYRATIGLFVVRSRAWKSKLDHKFSFENYFGHGFSQRVVRVAVRVV